MKRFVRRGHTWEVLPGGETDLEGTQHYRVHRALNFLLMVGYWPKERKRALILFLFSFFSFLSIVFLFLLDFLLFIISIQALPFYFQQVRTSLLAKVLFFSIKILSQQMPYTNKLFDANFLFFSY